MHDNEYADGIIDAMARWQLLKQVDAFNIANNTIVIYTTDNGPNQFSWPDAATTPFRSEKDTNWEGAFRMPAMIRLAGAYQGGRSLDRESSRGSTGFRRCLRRRATTRSRIGC